MVEKIGQAKYISTIDLTKGYWQIPMAVQDKEKTAFGTPWGLFQLRRILFGLHGAVASFQHLMDKILAPREYASEYTDDTIFSEDWEQHCKRLRVILTELHRTRLTANPRKCVMG